MKNILGSLPARLLLGVIAGILVGLYANEALMQVILTIKNLLGSLIIFCVPLIIIGFIAPSITRLGQLMFLRLEQHFLQCFQGMVLFPI